MKKILLLSCLSVVAMMTYAQASKTLVTYFSATGTTRSVAQQIAKAAGADLWEIVPKEAYTSADLDWTDKQSRSSIEMNDPSARPALAAVNEHIADYDTLFIGYPIWWYVAPRIINTFVEVHDLEGKVLIPFATSGSSAIGPTVKALRESYPYLNWQAGRLLNHASEAQIKAWVSGL